MATSHLKERGYVLDFEVEDEGLVAVPSSELKKVFSPADVKVLEYHRFEGATDPADMAIVYALETTDGDKGVLIDAYGTYSSSRVAEFLKQVEEKIEK